MTPKFTALNQETNVEGKFITKAKLNKFSNFSLIDITSEEVEEIRQHLMNLVELYLKALEITQESKQKHSESPTRLPRIGVVPWGSPF